MATSYTQQVAFRGRNDDVTLNSTVWTYTQGQNWSQAVDTTFRIRLQVEEINSKVQAVTGQLEASLNSGGYFSVTAASTIVKAVTSVYSINDVAVTPKQLTGSARTLTAGWGCEDGLTANISLNNSCLENEYAVQIVGANVSNGDTITLRIASMNGWTSIPSITVSKALTYTLVVQSPLAVQSSDNVALIQHYGALALGSPIQAQSVNSVILEQCYDIYAANAQHAQTADNVILTAYVPTVNLTVQDAQHAQVTTSIVFTQHYALVVTNIEQTHVANNVSITAHYTLAVTDVAQAHIASTTTLTAHYALIVINTEQAQVANSVSLTQHYALAVASTEQEHAVDNVTVTAHYALALVNITTQSQVADVPILIQNYLLVVLIATQILYSENVTLGGGTNVPVKMMHYNGLRSK